MFLLYLNVYAVTRHFGGREEGGWWYNAGQPLASVPIAAHEIKGHEPGTCPNCDDARRPILEGDTEAPTADFCHDEGVREEFLGWVRECAEEHAWYQLGGKRLKDLPVEERDQLLEDMEERCYQQRPHVTHLVAVRSPVQQSDGTWIDSCDLKRQELEALFAEHKHGNIYSVRGGVDIEIRLEEHLAEPWPKERPRYE